MQEVRASNPRLGGLRVSQFQIDYITIIIQLLQLLLLLLLLLLLFLYIL